MVGGTVIEVVDLATKVYVNCADKRGLKCGVDWDIKIPRRGYSGVSHPSRSSS